MGAMVVDGGASCKRRLRSPIMAGQRRSIAAGPSIGFGGPSLVGAQIIFGDWIVAGQRWQGRTYGKRFGPQGPKCPPQCRL